MCMVKQVREEDHVTYSYDDQIIPVGSGRGDSLNIHVERNIMTGREPVGLGDDVAHGRSVWTTDTHPLTRIYR
jgi:hypothetical protein